jgi:hypothetical protein
MFMQRLVYGLSQWWKFADTLFWLPHLTKWKSVHYLNSIKEVGSVESFSGEKESMKQYSRVAEE